VRRLAWLALPLVLASACTLAPRYERPAPPVPAQWPAGPAYLPATDGPAGLPWREVLKDARLQTVVERALANNRDLRATVANAIAARALYRVQRSALFPTLGVQASGAISRRLHGSTDAATSDSSSSGSTGVGASTQASATNSYQAYAGVSAFELDLFGRQRSLTASAFQQYLATEAGLRSARITLVAETAAAYAALAADTDLLGIATNLQKSAERTLELTQTLHDAGLAAGTDVANARTVVAQARADIELQMTRVAQDRNALELLVGAPVEDALLPASLEELDRSVGNVPAGLSSTVLLARPDVLSAEHLLRSANENIGAARAAFFPTISLTAAIGVASKELSTLFDRGSAGWSVQPSATLPLLGGPRRPNLAYAKAEREYRLAQYERAVQGAFRDVADGLARRGTIDRQRAAQADLVAAAEQSYRLAQAQYQAGAETFLNALVSQRTLYGAQQSLVSTILTDVDNRISLYQYVGADDVR
jgi:multidrug efflux system outer membrane protein